MVLPAAFGELERWKKTNSCESMSSQKVPFQPFLLVKSSHEKSKSTSSCLKIVLLTLLSSSMTRGSRSLLPSSPSTFCPFSIQSQCMSRLPTYMPHSCLRTHSVIVRPGGGPRVSYLRSALWDGCGECVCCSSCAREMLGGQFACLVGLFTASEDLGSRSTHVFSCTCSCDVVRKPAVPLRDRAG